jgi:hypothetical protein
LWPRRTPQLRTPWLGKRSQLKKHHDQEEYYDEEEELTRKNCY